MNLGKLQFYHSRKSYRCKKATSTLPVNKFDKGMLASVDGGSKRRAFDCFKGNAYS